MKKILTLAAAALLTLAAQAQTEQKALVDSKPWDNWFIGVNGGASVKTTHNKWLKNLNALGGVRVGRWFTPCFGLVVDDQVWFQDRPYATNHGTVATYNTMNFGAPVNLSNWFGGYKGAPRCVEVILLPELGWTHAFGNQRDFAQNQNMFDAKLALDFAVNLGKQKAIQLYLEPALAYNIYENGSDHFNMDINRSCFQLTAGLIYKFKNTNGTHNFRYAEPQIVEDMTRIDALNSQLNQLRSENARLQSLVQELQNRPEPKPVEVAAAANIMPVVIFKQGSAKIDRVQYAEIEKVAQFMKANENAQIEVKGFASTEGSQALNDKLSERRATAVADLLVKKYGIEADRIRISSYGPTAEQSETRAFNRVVTFSEVK